MTTIPDPAPDTAPPDSETRSAAPSDGISAAADNHAGHRARLRARLIENPDGLHDHELLEYLLTLAIPRRDTKPIAKQLLREFGALGGVAQADSESLRRVPHMGDSGVAAIRIAQAVAVRMLRNETVLRPIISSWDALIDYLRADMAHRAIERVRVLHLNTKNMIIRDELVSEGSVDQAAIYVREIMRRALELGSASLIMVHNHPSGDAKPSHQDIQITKNLIEAGRHLGIGVHDHLIIAGDQFTSMRAQGLL